MGPFGEAAKEYRKNGWRGTLPLPPKAKEEPPAGYTGHGSPYPSEKDVRVWLKQNADGNICLRLAGVDYKYLRHGLPEIYGGNNVDGWELIGIDVDDYGEKHGYQQLLALEEQLGKLPPTVVSSARWDEAPMSGTRIFLVPKGFRFKGKAAATGHEGPKHIDVLYAGLRYLVVWPSVHPTGMRYEFRYGAEGQFDAYEEAGPAPLEDVELLPLAWFRHLLSGAGSDADAKSDMDAGELQDWAIDTFRDPKGEPCKLMAREVAKYIAELDDSDSHHPLNDVVWRVTLNALEGHAGWHTALNDYIGEWIESVKGKRDLEEAQGEVLRTIDGALAKAKAKYDERQGYMADDKCDESAGDPDAWAKKFEEDIEKIAESDFGGLGPVVGPMEVVGGKPADDYGRHDDGNGEHFIDVYGDNVKYVDGRGKGGSWVLWSGGRWHTDTGARRISRAYQRVRRNQERRAREMFAEATANDDKELARKAKTWLEWARRSGNVGQIKTALEAAERLDVDGVDVAMRANMFDAKENLLGCANGVIDLWADEIDVRQPAKSDYVTFNTGVPYVPWRSLANAEGEMFEGYELWLEYLSVFLPDEKVRRYVQKVLGHLIVGGNPDKRLVFLLGPHDTGKSTMLGAIQGALGEYYVPGDIALFKQKDLNPGLADACPKRVIGFSEIETGTLDVSMTKRITGNEMVKAELKYSNDIFYATPQFTPLIAGNALPNVSQADDAIAERLLILPFEQTIDRNHRRYERQRDIENHSGVAVLSWLIEGWKMYRLEKLDNMPQAVARAQKNILSHLNAQQAFISECLVKAVDTQEGRRVLENAKRAATKEGYAAPRMKHLPREWTAEAPAVYEAYKRWAIANGVQPPVSHPMLTKEIGIGRPQPRKIDGKLVRCYYGLMIKDAVETRIGGGKLR